MAETRKVIITCAVTGAIHTPVDVAASAGDAREEIADAAIGAAEAGAAIVHLHARDPGDRPARPDARGVRALPAGDQAALRLRDQPDHRRRALHDDRGAGAAGGDVQARGRLAQHGLDEFRPVPDAGPLQGVQARLGAAAAGEQPQPRLQEHLPGHRVHPAHLRGERHAVRVRVLRHQPPLQPRPLPRPRPGQAAAVRPDRVRHPGRHRPASRGRAAHEAHGRPAVRRPATAGRCWAPGATRCRSRRMAAAMGGNVRVGLEDSLWDGPGRLAESNAAQVRRARQILEGLGLEIATPGRGARDPVAQGRRPGCGKRSSPPLPGSAPRPKDPGCAYRGPAPLEQGTATHAADRAVWSMPGTSSARAPCGTCRSSGSTGSTATAS